MHPVLLATFLLFDGRNLDSWKALEGEFAVEQGALVCAATPARMRSGFESDRYTLSFEYRRASHGINTLRTSATIEGKGGSEFLLTPYGLRWSEGNENRPPRRDDEWISARIELTPRVRASSMCGTDLLGDLNAGVPESKRGFISLSCTEKGLEIRNIQVAETGFKSLFDGVSTKGWEPVGKADLSKPNWTVKDGILRCGHQGGSWLRTLESYDNFVIRLEYWLPRGGNSGVYLHAPLQGRVSQIGQEIQLIDDAGWPKKLAPSQCNGSVYAGIAPEVRVPAPAEEWNAIEIFTQGKRIRTTVNGVQLYDARLDETARDAQLLKAPLTTRRLTGFIGLQDHTGGPRFRNIRIRVLPPESRPAS